MSTCYSGGAEGADLLWGRLALNHGNSLIHFSFDGHRMKEQQDHRHELRRHELEAATERLLPAAKALNRRLPPFDVTAKTNYTRCLLARNWYQVKDAERVYSVARLDRNGQVKGGTAWAVQMAFQRGLEEIYRLDDYGNWHILTRNGWKSIDDVPKPHGEWAGIGTRDLHYAPQLAMKELFR